MRGEWIEITVSNLATRVSTSRPVRGEWIEMLHLLNRLILLRRLAPCGASGLKYKEVQRDGISVASLAPCGASGLKSVDGYVDIAWIKSRPVRGEWIEMC